MIGIVPSTSNTFIVEGDFNNKTPSDGRLYYDPKDYRLYFYSSTEKRSNPNTGFYPIWNGKETFITTHSNVKYFDKDAMKVDFNSISNAVNKDLAESIRYQQRRGMDSEILNPSIMDGDNMFTQCIKGVIAKRNITMVDLIDQADHSLKPNMIENYYTALTKISFMRLDKWDIWVNLILHIRYQLDIFKGRKKILSYNYPENKFDTGIVKYDNIISSNADPFKKVVRIIMIMENITKSTLRSDDIDDYTINNMMTTITGNKSLSAQLFSRFIRMANLTYRITIYDETGKIFEYKE